jgi:hypothetical protein
MCHYCGGQRPRRAKWFYTVTYPERMAIYCDTLKAYLITAIPLHPIVATCPTCALEQMKKFITFKGVRA